LTFGCREEKNGEEYLEVEFVLQQKAVASDGTPTTTKRLDPEAKSRTRFCDWVTTITKDSLVWISDLLRVKKTKSKKREHTYLHSTRNHPYCLQVSHAFDKRQHKEDRRKKYTTVQEPETAMFEATMAPSSEQNLSHSP
jgi:hypothetical protein